MAYSTNPNKPTGGGTREYGAEKADRGSRCGARGCDGPVFVAKIKWPSSIPRSNVWPLALTVLF